MPTVSLDAMIRHEDFAREIKGAPAPGIIRELKLSDLLPNSAIRRQLRKPEFQRETNHWSPPQVLKFLISFIDGAMIPSIILWRSTNFVFVIDGAHRLSALCAWGGDNLSATFSPELADITLYVIDVSAGDKIPRKGGPGITRSDILIVNKTDLAPLVSADLDLMARDAKAKRGDKPVVFANMRTGEGLERIVALILELSGLPQRRARFVRDLPPLTKWRQV